MTTPFNIQSSALRDFVRESNRIEGIEREPSDEEIAAHSFILAIPQIKVTHLIGFVATVAQAELRDRPGLDVRVGNHRPPPGGPEIRTKLEALVSRAKAGRHPYATHIEYEELHPFTDGNGRSGRVLWAWQMNQAGAKPFALPFLHRFYYQTLDASR